MFRMGRGSCDGCEGRRPWRFLGHTRGTTLLLVAAVAACTLPSTATDTVNLHRLHTSISRHSVRSLTCSCLLPSEYTTSAAAPGLPVLEVARQHRISKPVRAATSSPEQRVVIHAALSSPFPLSCQHVNCKPQRRASCRLSDIGFSPRNIMNNELSGALNSRLSHELRQCSRHTTRVELPAPPLLPQIRRDKALAQKAGPPCLKQPRLGRCVCDTDRRQGFVAPDVHTLRLSPRGHATRFEQDPGSMSNVRFRTLAPCVRRSAACWGQCHFELRHLAVDTDATCKNTRTHRTRCTAPRHSPRRLDPSYRHCKVATGSQLPPPPLLLHRPPLHHLSRSKSRRPGTTTFEFVFYSAAAIKFDQLKSPGLSSCRSSFTSCFTSSASMSPQRLCCTAPALRFLATPKHGSIFGLPHCCCSLPNQA